MKSFIRGRVVKSYDVEVSTPCMVECTEGFQELSSRLTVLKAEEEELPNSAHPTWLDTSELEAEAERKAELIVAEAETRAREISAQAETRAQEILAQAETRAQEIRTQAQNESNQLRQETRKTAQAEGYQAGFETGREAGQVDGKQITENARQLFQLAQRAFQEEYAKVDGDLLHLAIKIAERIVRSSLTFEPQRLAEIIQALALLPEERSGWRLHVSGEDALWLEKLPPEAQPPCPWLIDESLGPGNCFLECQEGIFDARIEAQLEKLEHVLREELEHGGLESINSNSGTD